MVYSGFRARELCRSSINGADDWLSKEPVEVRGYRFRNMLWQVFNPVLEGGFGFRIGCRWECNSVRIKIGNENAAKKFLGDIVIIWFGGIAGKLY